MLKAVCQEIAGKLREGDMVSVVTWSSEQDVPLNSLAVTGPNDPALLSVFSSLASGGGTDLSGGLERGYELAQMNHSEDMVSRVLLISDGGANLGVTDGELIGRMAALDGDAHFMYRLSRHLYVRVRPHIWRCSRNRCKSLHG